MKIKVIIGLPGVGVNHYAIEKYMIEALKNDEKVIHNYGFLDNEKLRKGVGKSLKEIERISTLRNVDFILNVLKGSQLSEELKWGEHLLIMECRDELKMLTNVEIEKMKMTKGKSGGTLVVGCGNLGFLPKGFLELVDEFVEVTKVNKRMWEVVITTFTSFDTQRKAVSKEEYCIRKTYFKEAVSKLSNRFWDKVLKGKYSLGFGKKAKGQVKW
jgi:hypothetical protein